MSNFGFVKYNRSESAENLECKPIENHILNVIARRVSREGNAVKGVKIGEALIGDYKEIGLKRQPYRTAITNLKKWGYITTRATSKGTYASLVNTDVYDCNLSTPNQQANQKVTNNLTTNQPTTQPTANHYQEAKKKEVKEVKKEYIFIEEFLKIKNGEIIRTTQLDKNFHFGLFKDDWSDKLKDSILDMFRYLEGKEDKPAYWGNIGTLTTQLNVLKSCLNEFSEQEVIQAFKDCKFASRKAWNMYLKKDDQKSGKKFNGTTNPTIFNTKTPIYSGK